MRYPKGKKRKITVGHLAGHLREIKVSASDLRETLYSGRQALRSLDTNILACERNSDCAEFQHATAALQAAFDDREEWIIADQVYLELYKALRTPHIFGKPYGAEEDFSKIQILRDECGLCHCC